MRLDAGCEGEKATEREQCETQSYSKQGMSVLLSSIVMRMTECCIPLLQLTVR